ncbi:eukaryotic translation initiation factor 3 subunit A-like [Selaginella moellendorffii]|uniref:eukaryotic translation initiation factor 3 subunit A-like n=1 Tax=Selaginella moellendorffii TaxID=88036 RepID=UPI000D1C476F|nr:eukaryotic translation initiation factor 3 subunit A-like [Selaginella moellendorffii]|eukprot:XP_024523490.1 eukaryotic translation initiation factor 3 subunit A-like [Selaginella moellendorffii]
MVAMVEAAASAAQASRPDRADRKAVEAAAAAAEEEIKALQGRIVEIKAQLESSKGTRYAQSPELVEARNKLAVMNASFADNLEEKRRIKAELEAADKIREQGRVEARALREKLPSAAKLELIDAEIQRLEYRIQHTSLAIKEERGAMAQLKELRRSREMVVEYNQRMEQIAQEQELRGAALERAREKDKLLTSLKAEINELKKTMDQIRESEAAKALDTSALAAERNSAYERIKNLREGINARWSEFFAREKVARERRAVAARQNEERRRAEWLEREKTRKRIAEENFVEKYTDEIILCEQLGAYLQKLTPVEVAEDKLPETPASREAVASVEGFGTMLQSKKNRSEDEGWFAGKSKEPSARGKKGKGAVPPKEKLCLSLDALASFAKLGISPPSTVGEANKVVETLKTKKGDFVKLQASAKAAREKSDATEETTKDEMPESEFPKVDEALPQKLEEKLEAAA